MDPAADAASAEDTFEELAGDPLADGASALVDGTSTLVPADDGLLSILEDEVPLPLPIGGSAIGWSLSSSSSSSSLRSVLSTRFSVSVWYCSGSQSIFQTTIARRSDPTIS